MDMYNLPHCIDTYCIDDVFCGIALTSTTFTGYEGDRFATICLQLISQEPRDASAQLVTLDGVGTATGMKNNKYQGFPQPKYSTL